MLAEARGFRVGLTLAHQNLAQLPAGVARGHQHQRPQQDHVLGQSRRRHPPGPPHPARTQPARPGPPRRLPRRRPPAASRRRNPRLHPHHPTAAVPQATTGHRRTASGRATTATDRDQAASTHPTACQVAVPQPYGGTPGPRRRVRRARSTPPLEPAAARAELPREALHAHLSAPIHNLSTQRNCCPEQRIPDRRAQRAHAASRCCSTTLEGTRMPVPSLPVLPAVCAADRVSIPVPATTSAAAGLPQLLRPSGQRANVETAA